MARPPLLLKQEQSIVDSRTTICCLKAAGQIKPLDQPFDTILGLFDHPPFHEWCRGAMVPWVPGFVSTIRVEANAELLKRPKKQIRRGPEFEAGRGRPGPPPVEGNEPVDERGNTIVWRNGVRSIVPPPPTGGPLSRLAAEGGFSQKVVEQVEPGLLARVVAAFAAPPLSTLPHDEWQVVVRLLGSKKWSSFTQLPAWFRTLILASEKNR